MYLSYTEVASEKISSSLIAVSNCASRMRLAHSSRNWVRFLRRCATNSRNKSRPLSGMGGAASFSVLFFSRFIAELHNDYSTKFTHDKLSTVLAWQGETHVRPVHLAAS